MKVPSRCRNILEIHWSCPPTTGGVESHVADLTAGLSDRGRRVVLMTGEADPVVDGRCSVIVTPWLDLGRIRAQPPSEPVAVSGFENLLTQVVAQYDIGIVHGHNLHHFHPAPALAIERVRRRHDLCVFHTFHETWPDLLRDNPIYRTWTENFAVSRHVQEQCRATLGFAPTLFPLGVDTDVFRSPTPCFASGRTPVVLHPARLLPWKGVDVSIRALRILLDRGHVAELVVTDTQRIADWNHELEAFRAEILNLVEDLGLTSSVRFVHAGYADMPRLYQDADIVVYPTVGEEPYGLVPIEAMSCARPVVASLSGGIVETVQDGVTGYLVPKQSADALADRLMTLMSDHPKARRMGEAGRVRTQTLFSSSEYISRLLDRFALETI